jgi:hypothetical protein
VNSGEVQEFIEAEALMDAPHRLVSRRDSSSIGELLIYGAVGALSGLIVAALMMAVFFI